MVAHERRRGILEEPVLTLIPSEEYGKVRCGNGGGAAAFSIADTRGEHLGGEG